MKQTLIVQRISPLSAGKLLGGVYGSLALLIGSVWSLVVVFEWSRGPEWKNDPVASVLFGPGAVLVMPIIYGVTSFFFGVMLAFTYNVSASLFGGLKLQIEQPDFHTDC